MEENTAAPVAIRIVRPYQSEEEFLASELETVGKTSVILIGAHPRPTGIILRFEVTLASGATLLRGEGRVLGHKESAFRGQAGLSLRFTRLDPKSKALVDRAAAMREARLSGSIPAPPAPEQPAVDIAPPPPAPADEPVPVPVSFPAPPPSDPLGSAIEAALTEGAPQQGSVEELPTHVETRESSPLLVAPLSEREPTVTEATAPPAPAPASGSTNGHLARGDRDALLARLRERAVRSQNGSSSTAPDTVRRIDAVLEYWYGPDPHADNIVTERWPRWFCKPEDRPRIDGEIREMFSEEYERAARGELDHWAETARGRLALILVCDQFPRCLFRDQGRAFATDEKAQQLSKEGIARGHDKQLSVAERLFFYMPLTHSENLENQKTAIALRERLVELSPPNVRAGVEQFANIAKRHLATIERFGRFPHRNAALGRPSTPEEAEFLTTAPQMGRGATK